MGLTEDFARRKFRGAYTVTVVSQETIATAYSLDGNVSPVKRDTGKSVLRFSRRADLARFLRNSPPPLDTIYRLNGLDLSGLDLRGAQLQEAEFTNCNLDRADLTGANMLRARIKECSMRRTTLTGANLMGAEIAHADMTGAHFGVRLCTHLEMKWCTNPPQIPNGPRHEPVYIHAPRYTGAHKIRGLIRKLS